ncbi:MAG: acyl-CoA dehydrogenase family protein [Acidimicrobiia bacterium]|nr:acyl-CoA dehydrogenase family protein [Acidimicrobiia bacterium]
MTHPPVSDPLDAAVRLTPTISARSTEIEEQGRLPQDLVDLIRPTGAFRQWVPTELDGPAIPAWESLQVIEQYGYADGAVGWCVAIATTSSLMAAFLPPEWGKVIYADPDSITGGFAMPKGRARPLPEGGLEVTGRWQWGSGTSHCTWIGGGCLVVDTDGKPASRPTDGLRMPFVFFDSDDVEIIPTWDVSGLSGTGSNDYAVDGAHVPEGRWVEIGTTEATYPNPLTQFSFYGLLALAVAATTVGIARRSIDELVSLAHDKRPQGSSRSLRERAVVQHDVATAEARLQAAWALMESTVDRSWRRAEAGGAASGDERRQLRMAATHATQTAAGVAETMYKTGGGAAVYRSSPLQRCLRDSLVATQHAMVAPRTMEVAGRHRLGLETDLGLF